MRITELIEKFTMPHVFLDMDGVQSDFDTGWSNFLGVPHVDHIKDSEEAILQLAHSSADDVYKMFKSLNPLPGGQQLVSWLKFARVPYTILSAPLRGPYSNASIKGKKEWLNKYHPGSSDTAIFTSDKFRHAMDGGIANVLVDDYGKQLNAWAKAGGIAIKHEDSTAESTIQQLKDIYKQYMSPGGIVYDKTKDKDKDK